MWYNPEMLQFLALLVFGTWYFGLLFSSYAAFHRARKEGTFRPAHWFVAGPVLVQGWPLDVVWNIFPGSLCFGEWPWQNWDWTFTARVERHAQDAGWRGKVYRWWKGILNALDPGHI